jgi:light-regulated signal transduction histidine kinase (bacteriophytochrome)
MVGGEAGAEARPRGVVARCILHRATPVTLAAAALASAVAALALARRCGKLGQEIDRRQRELEGLARGRREELAGLGHKVRNALGTISVSTSLLEARELPEEKKGRHLTAIRRAVGRVDQVLQDHLVLN